MEDYKFDELINPVNLFHSIEEVQDFILLSNSIEELQVFNIKCLEEELYEYCLVIQQRINEIKRFFKNT